MLNKNKKLTAVSLFSGCGGLDLGFIKAGFDIIWANDNSKNACDSYKKNLGNNIICKSILEINLKNIPHSDIVIGGPPCQGFSCIGKRNPNDKRSLLVWNYIDVIKNIKPKVFLFENVTGIKSAISNDGSKIIDNLIIAFKEIGYHINLYTLNAADYGVPQRRKRVFIIGNKMGINITPPNETHSEKGNHLKKWVSSFEAISDLPSPVINGKVNYLKNSDCDYQKFIRNGAKSTTLHFPAHISKKEEEIIPFIKQGGNYMDVPDSVATQRILNYKTLGGRTTTYGRLDPKMPAYTLSTSFNKIAIGCNIHYDENRVLTVREGLRLQSFPDDFEIVSSSILDFYAQVGNAVPPLLGYAWAKKIKEIILDK